MTRDCFELQTYCKAPGSQVPLHNGRSTRLSGIVIPVVVWLFSSILALNAQALQDQPAQTSVLTKCQPVIVKLFGAGVGNLDSYGTGILVSKEGHVLTVWNHLVSTGFLTAVTSDGRRFAVETVGTSAEHDAALIKLKTEPGETFPFVDLNAARTSKWVLPSTLSVTCFVWPQATNLSLWCMA